MTSKTIALRALDLIFIAFTTILLLTIAGLPSEWLLDLIDMSLRDFRSFGLFVLFASLLLMYAIATSDSAP